jgi:hypothetical protein
MMDHSLAAPKREIHCHSHADWKSRPALCLAILIAYLGASATRDMSSQNSDTERVSVCELNADPARYNHKSVEVTGFFSHGFENFAMFDPGCPSRQGVWLDYGGRVSSGTMYCCPGSPERTRAEPLVVENIEIPLVDDKRFRTFDKLIQRRPDSVVHATVKGKFFSGRELKYPGGVFWGGYGHLGCCTLLAIEQVIAVDPQDRDDLDYRASPGQPDDLKVGCSYKGLAPLLAPIEAQHEAESGERVWSFTNPERVATDALARFTNVEEKSIAGLTQIPQAQGRTVYQWHPEDSKKRYMVVVSRPYWLSFYAKDLKKVAWVVIAAYETSCN